MIKKTLFLFFFYFGVIFVCIFFLPALFLPQKITIYGGKILGIWSKFCLEIFLSTKVIVNGKEKVLTRQEDKRIRFIRCWSVIQYRRSR